MILTRTQKARLQVEPDDWVYRDSEWRAGRTFLFLEDHGLVEWQTFRAGDIRSGPGSHGGGWLTRRTAKGRRILGLELGDV